MPNPENVTTPFDARSPLSDAPGYDPAAAVAFLRQADPALGRVIDVADPFEIEATTTDVFAALAESIAYQQLTGKAAATIFSRVLELFPAESGGFIAERVAEVSDEELRGAGLSRSKVLSLRDLAHKVCAGVVPSVDELQSLDDEEVIERLVTVRGIGRWTTEMFLMFRLRRPDVLPVDDFGVRKGFMLAYGLEAMPTPKELRAHGERWAPYRSVASWYMWRAVELYSTRSSTPFQDGKPMAGA